MDMSIITTCQASECAYNNKGMCHALAITVGSGTDHHCDTFWPAASKGGDPAASGGVGACKVPDCRHNKNLICGSPDIEIGPCEGEIGCLTFCQ